MGPWRRRGPATQGGGEEAPCERLSARGLERSPVGSQGRGPSRSTPTLGGVWGPGQDEVQRQAAPADTCRAAGGPSRGQWGSTATWPRRCGLGPKPAGLSKAAVRKRAEGRGLRFWDSGRPAARLRAGGGDPGQRGGGEPPEPSGREDWAHGAETVATSEQGPIRTPSCQGRREAGRGPRAVLATSPGHLVPEVAQQGRSSPQR